MEQLKQERQRWKSALTAAFKKIKTVSTQKSYVKLTKSPKLTHLIERLIEESEEQEALCLQRDRETRLSRNFATTNHHIWKKDCNR